MGRPHRIAPTVHLPPSWAKLAGGEGAVEFERQGCGIEVENWARRGDRADLPARAADQAAQAAGSDAGCRAGCGPRAGVDRGEVGGAAARLTISGERAFDIAVPSILNISVEERSSDCIEVQILYVGLILLQNPLKHLI